jgi:hypothetical protein
MPPILTDQFKRAIQYQASRCVLLVGAGVSVGPVRKTGEGLPNWKSLIGYMIEDLKDSGASTNNLARLKKLWKAGQYLKVASVYKRLTTPSQFSDFLKEHLDPSDLGPSRVHRAILKAGFEGIITTNFDRVFEQQDGQLDALVYPQFLLDSRSFKRSQFFTKIHGCIRRTTDLYNDLILTEESFSSLRKKRAYHEYLHAIFLKHCVLTVGYSLRDPDFIALIDDLRDLFKKIPPDIYALMLDPGAKKREDWRRRKGVTILAYKNHNHLPGVFLAMKHLTKPGRKSTKPTALPAPKLGAVSNVAQASLSIAGPTTNREQLFLRVARGPSLKLGDLDLKCKVFPESLWSVDRPRHTFLDDEEAECNIQLKRSHTSLPHNLLETLVRELEERTSQFRTGQTVLSKREIKLLTEIHWRLTLQGSNAYPRLVALPRLTSKKGSGEVLEIDIGPSRYGIALVEERGLSLPTAVALRSRFILNSLAVRVALVYEHERQNWVEFHQRKGGPNATYKRAWDVSAAGYVDPIRHRDPENPAKVSPWQAAAHELAEELGIPLVEFPYRDNYHFFGVGRNDPTGQLDLLAYYASPFVPDPTRPPTPRVSQFGRCRLDPESVASFIGSNKYWVPTAILTLILTLEAFGFTRDRIRESFAPLVGKLRLGP